MTLSKAIEDLKSELVLMARKAESTFEESVSCLESRNETQVDMVRKLDAEIDRMEIELDNHCMRLLALRDPLVPQLLMTLIDRLNALFPNSGRQLSVMRNNLAWKSIVQPAG